MYVEVLVLFLYTTIYAMLFDVCALLYNPFGPREIDIQHYKVGGGIRHLAKSLSTGAYPATMKPGKMHDDFLPTMNDNDMEMLDHRITVRMDQPRQSMLFRSRRSLHVHAL